MIPQMLCQENPSALHCTVCQKGSDFVYYFSSFKMNHNAVTNTETSKATQLYSSSAKCKKQLYKGSGQEGISAELCW